MRRLSSPGSLRRETLPGAPPLEPVTPLYFETSGDGAADGGDSPGGDCLLYATTGVGIAAGRLSHYSNPHVLSGRKSGCGGDDGYGSSRASIRTTSGPKPDDFQQLGRLLRRRPPIQSQSE